LPSHAFILTNFMGHGFTSAVDSLPRSTPFRNDSISPASNLPFITCVHVYVYIYCIFFFHIWINTHKHVVSCITAHRLGTDLFPLTRSSFHQL